MVYRDGNADLPRDFGERLPQRFLNDRLRELGTNAVRLVVKFRCLVRVQFQFQRKEVFERLVEYRLESLRVPEHNLASSC